MISGNNVPNSSVNVPFEEMSEVQQMVHDVKNLLSGGIHPVEITESAWESLVRMAVEEYISAIQDWITTNTWINLLNQDLNTTDICFALTTGSIDIQMQFAHAYSKQIGLSTEGKWELKKDFVELVDGQQTYVIPAGREINSVLWHTTSDIDMARFMAMSNNGFSYGGGGGNLSAAVGTGSSGGFGVIGGGMGAHYIAPAYDILLRASDINLKHKIMKSELTYRVTDGSNGTKILHLLSTPNKGNQIGSRKDSFTGRVWYYYYDTGSMDENQKKKCLSECNDIVRFPSDIPLTKMSFNDLNNPSKIRVRKFLSALAKEALGRSRGKFKGEVPFPDASITLDYDSLLAEGKEELSTLRQELKEWLENLAPDKQLEKAGAQAENLNKMLSKVPNKIWVI